MRDALRVSEPSGERWDLALNVVRTGEGAFTFGHLCIYRDVHGPMATGRIQVEILTRNHKVQGSERADLLAEAKRSLDTLWADGRLKTLVAEFGGDWLIVFDDDHTRFLVDRLEASDVGR